MTTEQEKINAAVVDIVNEMFVMWDRLRQAQNQRIKELEAEVAALRAQLAASSGWVTATPLGGGGGGAWTTTAYIAPDRKQWDLTTVIHH